MVEARPGIIPTLTALFLSVLSACQPRLPSLDDEFRRVTALVRTERFDAAMPAAEVALERADQSKDPISQWRFRLLKVEILAGHGESLKAAFDFLNRLGDPPSTPEFAGLRAKQLLLRMQVLSSEGRLTDAEALLRPAKDAAAASGSDELTAMVELRRSALLAARDRVDEARSVMLETLSKPHDDYIEARATSYLGFTFLNETRGDEAVPWFDRARAAEEKLGAVESAARANGNLGAAYAYFGDYDNARERFDLAQKTFDRTGNRYEQQIWLGDSGNPLFYQRKYGQAFARYNKALGIAREIDAKKWIGRWLGNLAECSIELGQWDSARKYYEENLARGSGDRNHATSLLVIGARIAAGANQPEEAKRLFGEALRSEPDDPTISLDAHAGLARIYIQGGQPQKAENEYELATRAIDARGAGLVTDDSRLAFLSSLIRFNREYVDLLMRTHKDGTRGLEVAEASRSRVLAGRAGGLRTGTPLSEKDYRRVARDTGAVLLEYWMGDDRSWLWVVTPDRLRCHELPARSVIEPLVKRWRDFIAAGRNPLEVQDETGARLYDTLLKPVEADVPGKSKFIVVPDEGLDSLNFESLPSGGNPGKFWIEDATVEIAPSLNVLATRGRAGKPGGGILLIGDPESTDIQYPRLPFAGTEIDSIANTMSASNADVYRGSNARPAYYAGASPERFGYIHFSAHATANRVNPLDSAVILSGPPGQSRLRARDVMNLHLNAELVTVSACRSAGDKTYAGEGMVGFAWAFLKAGAANVIAGLWEVSDQSTMELMSRLYTEIHAGSPIPDALRKAKLHLIHDKGGAWAKPFYWAPFQVYTASGQ
jgi:CHAT domain-containing protein/Tfp pilus assembly protein PilF